MAEGCVIGVDLGGTKLLAGAVDADGTVHHRTNRPALGLDQLELVEMVAHAVEGVRRSVGGEVAAVGFGIPCTFDARTGLAVQAVNLPLRDIRFADVMAERLELPVVVDNDANCAVLAEARAGAGAGCSEVVMLTLGTGIGSGLVLRGEVYRGFDRAAARRSATWWSTWTAARARATAPTGAAWSRSPRARRSCARCRWPSRARPDTEHRPRAGGRARADRADDHARWPARAIPWRAAAIEMIGRALGVGLANLVNIFCPQVVVIGGGVSAAGDLLLAPAREVMARRALRAGPRRGAHRGRGLRRRGGHDRRRDARPRAPVRRALGGRPGRVGDGAAPA